MKTPYSYLPVISPLYRTVKKQAYATFYRGNSVTCPICEKHFRAWVGNKQHGTCPWCSSQARHRLLYLYLEQQSSVFTKPQKILHFAPENCWQSKLRGSQNIEYITADLSAPEADVHTDITDVCFDDRTFDVILCCHVLEHIPDDNKAIAQLYRVLVPGGVAYLQVPYNQHGLTDEDPSISDPRERERRFGQFDHVRFYGTDFPNRLEAAGFQVTQEYFARKLETATREKYGLWDDVIFCCTK